MNLYEQMNLEFIKELDFPFNSIAATVNIPTLSTLIIDLDRLEMDSVFILETIIRDYYEKDSNIKMVFEMLFGDYGEPITEEVIEFIMEIKNIAHLILKQFFGEAFSILTFDNLYEGGFLLDKLEENGNMLFYKIIKIEEEDWII